MAKEIPAAYARRPLHAMLALKPATIIEAVPFGDGRDAATQPLPAQLLTAHADALDLLRESLAAFEAAVLALERSQSQDLARSRALQIRAAGLIRRSAALRAATRPVSSPE